MVTSGLQVRMDRYTHGGVKRTDGGLSQTSSTTEQSPGSESPGLVTNVRLSSSSPHSSPSSSAGNQTAHYEHHAVST